MKQEEFNLSKHIMPSLSPKVKEGFIFEEDVKEFIKQLKEKIKVINCCWRESRFECELDKLLGDKLR